MANEGHLIFIKIKMIIYKFIEGESFIFILRPTHGDKFGFSGVWQFIFGIKKNRIDGVMNNSEIIVSKAHLLGFFERPVGLKNGAVRGGGGQGNYPVHGFPAGTAMVAKDVTKAKDEFFIGIKPF